MDRTPRIAAALRLIGRGYADLAAAMEEEEETRPTEERYRAVLAEWGERGLSREQASTLLRKYGFAPQAAGGWARGNWIETRADGLRYLTERSLQWLVEQADGG